VFSPDWTEFYFKISTATPEEQRKYTEPVIVWGSYTSAFLFCFFFHVRKRLQDNAIPVQTMKIDPRLTIPAMVCPVIPRISPV
jgi:hypothetical protein